MPSTRGLGPKNKFSANLAQKSFEVVTPEPYFTKKYTLLYQILQTNTHFIQNPEENLMNP